MGGGGGGGGTNQKKKTCADWYECFLEPHKTEDIQCSYKVDVVLSRLHSVYAPPVIGLEFS